MDDLSNPLVVLDNRVSLTLLFERFEKTWFIYETSFAMILLNNVFPLVEWTKCGLFREFHPSYFYVTIIILQRWIVSKGLKLTLLRVRLLIPILYSQRLRFLGLDCFPFIIIIIFFIFKFLIYCQCLLQVF